MTTTPDTFNTAIRNAMREANREASWSKNEDDQIDILTTAARETFAQLLPNIIKTAMEAPETNAAMVKQFVIPVLRELEDAIDEDRADPKTQASYRPGLQRAANTIRAIRRDIQKEFDK